MLSIFLKCESASRRLRDREIFANLCLVMTQLEHADSRAGRCRAARGQGRHKGCLKTRAEHQGSRESAQTAGRPEVPQEDQAQGEGANLLPGQEPDERLPRRGHTSTCRY